MSEHLVRVEVWSGVIATAGANGTAILSYSSILVDYREFQHPKLELTEGIYPNSRVDRNSMTEMYRETPNEEVLDWWIDRMKSRYQYERLKDMSLDRLHNMEYEVEIREKILKAGFPHDNSAVQGEMRQFILDDPQDTKEALNQAEKLRLDQATEDIKHEIYRAKGTKLKERREHRSKLFNGVVDALDALARLVGNLNPLR